MRLQTLISARDKAYTRRSDFIHWSLNTDHRYHRRYLKFDAQSKRLEAKLNARIAALELDSARLKRIEAISGEDGVWSCTAVGVCSDVCPKHVNPANAVNQNKTNSAFDFFLRFLRKDAR